MGDFHELLVGGNLLDFRGFPGEFESKIYEENLHKSFTKIPAKRSRFPRQKERQKFDFQITCISSQKSCKNPINFIFKFQFIPLRKKLIKFQKETRNKSFY
jgi:hypothetical protein